MVHSCFMRTNMFQKHEDEYFYDLIFSSLKFIANIMVSHVMQCSHFLFLIQLMLEQQGITSIAERMRDYQVVATLILLGPKLKNVQNQIQQDVKRIMSQNLHIPSSFGSGHYANKPSNHSLAEPSFVASCSPFGPKGVGVVTRVAAVTTESVYNFLRTQLSSLKPLLGVSPYC
nr:urease accessory protein D isoform X1 [Ipomoea batatas]